MVKITHLPDEIIVFILENKSISIEDVINFRSMCKRLQRITLSNCFWKKKICQRCSTTTKQYYLQKLDKIEHLNFEKQIKTERKCIKKLHYYVSLMSDNNLTKINKEELEYLLLFTVKNSIIYHFVLDELNRIIPTQLPWPPYFNLTIKYNYELIFNCLTQFRFMYKQTKFIFKPIKKQLVERQVAIVAQHFQSHISYLVIKTWLDNIAQDVLLRLKIKYPSHSIFSTSSEQFLFWKTNNIYDNYWDPTESAHIMRTLEEYVFSHSGIDKLFRFLSLIIPDFDAKYKKISDVSVSYTYLLSIIYQSIARRLGICCILMSIKQRDYRNFPEGDLKIIWKPKYNREVNGEYFYMAKRWDEIHPINIIRGRYYKDISPRLLKNSEFLHILIQMLQLLGFTLNVHCNINYKWNFKFIFKFLSHCSKNNIQKSLTRNQLLIKDITKIIQVRSDVAIEKQLGERKEIIKYAVGEIVTHKLRMRNILQDHCGVIVGWHYTYDERFLMQLNSYTNKNILSHFPYICRRHLYISKCGEHHSIDQPHYIIFIENNQMCYVEQDDISLCSPREINNVEIGRFFCRFEDTHYVPNKYLEQNNSRYCCNFLKNISN